jgi:hypothetical protein
LAADSLLRLVATRLGYLARLLGTWLLALTRVLLVLLDWLGGLLALVVAFLAFLENDHSAHLQLHEQLLDFSEVAFVSALLSLSYLVQNLLVVGALLRKVDSILVSQGHSMCIFALDHD